MVHFSNSLSARVLRGKYYRRSSPLQISSTNIFYVYANISAAIQLILLVIRQKIHSRYDIKLWEDPWILKRSARLACRSDPVVYLRIDLIKGELKEWDVEMFENFVGYTTDS